MNDLVIVCTGALGASIAEGIAAAYDGKVAIAPTPPGHVTLAALPPAGFYILAASLPCPGVELAMSEAAHRWRRMLLPVMYDHPRLRIGPVSAGGYAGCSACYRSRVRQHAGDLTLADALDTHAAAAGAAAEPHGWLPTWELVSVAAAVRTARRLSRGAEDETKKVRHIDLLSGHLFQTRLIPVHGCRVCATTEGDPADRSVSALRGLVERLVSAAPADQEACA